VGFRAGLDTEARGKIIFSLPVIQHRSSIRIFESVKRTHAAENTHTSFLSESFLFYIYITYQMEVCVCVCVCVCVTWYYAVMNFLVC
jgi:hypothetical protein